MLDPDCLRAFLAVTDLGHFVRAADRLAVTQSVISKRLQRLEDQLGIRLIERGKRNRVQPTRAGELFAPEARRAIEGLERTERLGLNIARGEAGQIRIGYVFSAIITGILPRMIRTLNEQLPSIEVEPLSLETPQQLAAMAAGKLDFGVTRPRPSYPSGIVASAIHRERVILAVAANDPLACMDEIRVCDLSGRRFIVPQFHEEVGLIDIIRELARAGGFAIPPIIRTADFFTAAGLAAAGVGVATVPASLVRLNLEGMLYREIVDHDAWLEMVLVRRDDAPVGASAALLAACGLSISAA